MRVLLVEDEKDIASFIIKGLKAERFVVDWTARGEQAFMWAKINTYDAAVMDITIAGEKTGLQICREIRQRHKEFPIIMLSVIHDTATKVEALNAGADDYLTKPFSMIELLARIRALLRRERQMIGPIIKVADLKIDLNAHVATRSKVPLVLNRKEFALLEYLMRNSGLTLTRSMILEHVWETTIDPLTNTVDVHVRYLRAKVDDGHEKKLIRTVHGHGYKIEG